MMKTLQEKLKKELEAERDLIRERDEKINNLDFDWRYLWSEIRFHQLVYEQYRKILKKYWREDRYFPTLRIFKRISTSDWQNLDPQGKKNRVIFAVSNPTGRSIYVYQNPIISINFGDRKLIEQHVKFLILHELLHLSGWNHEEN